MRKLTLDLDELAVESFDTEEAPETKGTVEGHYDTAHCTEDLNGYTCAQNTCQPPSCPAFSCVSQCAHNCYETDSCTRYYLDGACM